MVQTYNCTTCNTVFETKSERKNHFRNFCQTSISLTDMEATIHQIERIDGQFSCPRCPNKFTRTDNLNTHWKSCSMTDETKSELGHNYEN